MKPKIRMYSICLVAVAALTVGYTVGWHNGRAGHYPVGVSEVHAQGGPPQDNIIDGIRYPDEYMPMAMR